MTLRIFFDLDGTLCDTPADIDHDDVRDLIDRCTPRQAALLRLRQVHALGHKVGIITGRAPYVRAATAHHLAQWLPGLHHDLVVHHRPRLAFDWRLYIEDKERLLRLEGADIYIGDRDEDQAAALRAGCRFVRASDFEAHGLTSLRTVAQ